MQYINLLAGRGKMEADAPSRIVFLGDSIIAMENWNVLFRVSHIANMGVSGNTTDNVMARLDGAISSKPQKLFLMIGVNDFLQGRDVAYVEKNYGTILDKIRLESPKTMVYVQSVLPVNNDILKYGQVDSQKIIDLNSRLKLLADGKKIFFIDLYPNFCGPDNKLYLEYSADGIHPNSHGYAVWKNLIEQYVE
jgi:lysophospholipase L1-like esterase